MNNVTKVYAERKEIPKILGDGVILDVGYVLVPCRCLLTDRLIDYYLFYLVQFQLGNHIQIQY